MIRVWGTPKVGGQNVLICTDLTALENNHPVCDDYKDDKGNVIETGLPCGEPTIAFDATMTNKKVLLNGSWN